MIFRDFDPSIHDIKKVATLIYDVDFRTFDSLFKTKEDGVLAIENRLIKEALLHEEEDKEEDGSFQCFVFFDDEDTNEKEIIGFFLGGKGFKSNFSEEIKFLFKNLKFDQACKLATVELLDNFVLVDVEEDDFYIAELAIDSSNRGKGYGKQAISQLIQIAKDLDCKRIVLDADFRNEGAFKLYKKIGFKIFKEKSLDLYDEKRGMYNMEYKLK